MIHVQISYSKSVVFETGEAGPQAVSTVLTLSGKHKKKGYDRFSELNPSSNGLGSNQNLGIESPNKYTNSASLLVSEFSNSKENDSSRWCSEI